LDAKIVLSSFEDLVDHLDNAEMTPELCHDLINFSFDCLQDFVKEIKKLEHGDVESTVHGYAAYFLGCLKRLVRYNSYPCILRILIR